MFNQKLKIIGTKDMIFFNTMQSSATWIVQCVLDNLPARFIFNWQDLDELDECPPNLKA